MENFIAADKFLAALFVLALAVHALISLYHMYAVQNEAHTDTIRMNIISGRVQLLLLVFCTAIAYGFERAGFSYTAAAVLAMAISTMVFSTALGIVARRRINQINNPNGNRVLRDLA